MSTPTVERAAVSALYWARPPRRNDAAIIGCCSHLSKEERREVVSLLDLRIFDPLSDDELRTAMAELAAKSRAGEHKIADAERKIAPTAVLDEPTAGVVDTGTFTGYLAAFGVDHGGDTIGPDAMTATVAEFTAGRIAWHLTDAHSEKASDVVATVTAAAVDRHGLRIDAAWMPTPRAQELRAMVRAGAKLGLSIDYFPVAARPDGMGGRFLDRITVVGGAVTPKPANAAAVITEGKHALGGFAQVLTVGQYTAQETARRERESPQRRAEDAMLAAASWPSPGVFDRETSLALIRRSAEAKSRRELAEGDPARARAQAKRDRDNEYSFALSAWMQEHQ